MGKETMASINVLNQAFERDNHQARGSPIRSNNIVDTKARCKVNKIGEKSSLDPMIYF